MLLFHPQIASRVAGPAQLPLGAHSFLDTQGALLGTIPPGICSWEYTELPHPWSRRQSSSSSHATPPPQGLYSFWVVL